MILLSSPFKIEKQPRKFGFYELAPPVLFCFWHLSASVELIFSFMALLRRVLSWFCDLGSISSSLHVFCMSNQIYCDGSKYSFIFMIKKSCINQVAQMVKNMPTMRETWVQSQGWEDPLEKGTATHFSILAWRISWTV